MMQTVNNSKVTAAHLARKAYLYIRQSTLRQVVENTESTKRQYALRQRAIALGWSDDQIVVIDRDLGRSAAAHSDRTGFAELVAAVGMGRAGIVLGLEVSRLARNSTDWHRLLEVCALFNTLILDEDGIYDPSHFNDRLLLGLKGTMSEAELHVLRSRLRGGILNKAHRGELRCKLPVGLVYDAADRVVLDPDLQVQASLRALFAAFDSTGAACATVRHFADRGLLFPVRPNSGPHKGDVIWQRLVVGRVLSILRNPRYAGAFSYGRQRTTTLPDGSTRAVKLPREEWIALKLDAHVGYISWDDYERTQKRITETAKAFGQDRRHGPPREGPALLQGLVICGVCGDRMTVRYRKPGNELLPTYACCLGKVNRAGPVCQALHGEAIDAAIGELLVQQMTPLALELSMTVQDEIRERLDESDRLRRMQVESVQYEVDLARQRYMQVDPSRRLVADSLEANWNEKLRDLETAREDYEKGCTKDKAHLDDIQRTRILDLAHDFPALWNAPTTSHIERKRMAALLLEDVTLTRRQDQIELGIRFRGGRTQTIEVAAPVRECDRWRTDRATIDVIDSLLNNHSTTVTARILNERGLTTGVGDPFKESSVRWVIRSARLKSLRQRLRAKGMLTTFEMAKQMGVCRSTVATRLRNGRLRGRRYSEQGERWLCYPLDQQPPDAASPPGNSPSSPINTLTAESAV
ncbi:MAG: recombinase family protein [Actinomycetia bacterium]|nr:recombinase family protein [Actinomycetes bacterium]